MRYIAFILTLLLTIPAVAQSSYTTIVATSIKTAGGSSGGTPINGSLCFTPTDQTGAALNFALTSQGQVALGTVCQTLVNGALSGTLQVANPADATPSPIYYRVEAFQTGSSSPVLKYSQVLISGSSWSLDSYLPVNEHVLPPVGGSINGNLGVNGNLSVGGSFSLGGVLGLGTAIPYQQAGFPSLNTKYFQITDSGNENFFSTPSVFISRNDSTQFNSTSCFSGPLAACDAPIFRISMTNNQTTNIPAMIGMEIDGASFRANGTSPPYNANFIVGYGAELSDAATPNTTNLRAGNFIVNLFGLPATAGPGGFTRSAVGLEVDTNNSSGTDAVPGIGGAAGNFIGAYSAIHNGANKGSAAYYANSSSSTSGVGYRNGLVLQGITDSGIVLAPGGTGSFSPTYGLQIAEPSSVGIVLGCGTISSYFAGVPCSMSTGILMDAQGYAPTDENQDSEYFDFRAKSTGHVIHDWKMRHENAGNLLDWWFDSTDQIMQLSSVAVLTLKGTTPELQIQGSSSARVGADTAGTFLTTDTASKTIRFNANGLQTLVVDSSGNETIPGALNAASVTAPTINASTTLEVAGSPIASTNLSDSSSLARLASPTFTGTVTAPNVNATTGYDVNGTPLASTNLSDSSALARLASPTFTGTLTAPTVNASTTLEVGGSPIASTNLSDTAALARLASPTFTGTLTAPTINASTTLEVGGTPLASSATSNPQIANTCYIAALNGVATYCPVVFSPKALTITRIYLTQLTGATGCTTFPVVSAFDLTNSSILTSVTESSSGGIDSGVISVSVTAAHLVGVRVTTAGSGCSPTAANVSVMVQWQQQ